MTQASVTFQLGAESVTSVLDINLDSELIITGDFGGLVAAGTTARLRGNVRLIDNIHVRGTLLCDPTGVDVDGQNLYDIHTHDGTLNLQGVRKSAWVRWGDIPVGWQVGDRLFVAPTAAGIFWPFATTWQGSWAATTRPANTADVTLPDGTVARPEVANLSQTVTLRNLKRIMVHEASAPNPQTLKWLRVFNSGETGVLGMYPIHFHMIGEHARGSLIEGVVVEGGRNHAFVPHGSHGITFRDTVAYNTISGAAYWWDPPVVVPPNPIKFHTANNSNDTIYEHVLGMYSPGPNNAYQMAGFVAGAGLGNSVVDSVMTCVNGGVTSAGWNWPEAANQNVGGTVWTFARNVGHNNKHSGIFVWQNDSSLHKIEDFQAYRNGTFQIDHGAYQNDYDYQRLVLSGGSYGFQLHATGDVLLEDIISDKPLLVTKHNADSTVFTVVRRCAFPNVEYSEKSNGGLRKSWTRYEDCGLVPADFNLWGIVAGSIIEIFEGGVLVHRWANGVWV